MPGRFGVSRFVTTIAGGLCLLVLCSTQAASQLAKGQSRFLGNALSSGIPIYSDFGKYWNQVTPGNAGKWESVEGFQGSYDWTWLDAIYNYAINNSYPFKDHCLIWGAQQPGWIAGLDSAHQRAKVEQWIDTVGGRYGSMSMVDVVNEPLNSVPVYKNALGGDGKTGWDWVVTAFQWARKYCMKGTKLLINEYNVLQDPAVTTRYLALIDTLRVRGLVDGIGIQGHYFEFKSYAGSPGPYSYPVPTLKANLERLTATGLPVYITEFEINEASDSIQLANYKIYFSLFWENPGVKGITHWGYKQGDMWKENGYLVRSNGTERPALQWLRTYVVRPIPPALVSPVGTTEPRNPRLVWRTSALASSYRVQVASNSAFSSLVVDSTLADTVNQLSPLAASTAYYWRVSASNDSGPGSYSSVAVFRTGDQIQAVEESPGRPVQFALEQNYPNPFNPETTLEFTIAAGSSTSPAASAVRLAVYDLLGREVALLVDEKRAPGEYRVRFNGSHLSSGLYVCRLTAGEFSASRTMCLVK